jgi:ribosomal-protein-alanine N-acetyltransferase
MRSVTPERLETERLVCERLTPDHAPELMTLLSDPRVAKTLFASAEPPSEAEMVENLGAKVAHWERFDFGLWLLRDRATGEMVGRGGLQHTFVGGCDEVEIGWAILPARWGQGLATEMARAASDVAFDDLRLGELVAFTLPENIASRRVMEKTGFNYERRIVHVGLPHVLYRLAAPTTG